MNLQQQFAAEVASFIEAHKMTPTAFGRDAIGDPSFVFEINEGRAPTLTTIDKVRAFMANHAAGQETAA
jgi:hypothetical protein